MAKDTEANQKLIAKLNDEAAPIRAEVRKVEAEVGPIKYIAAMIYGDNPDENMLERSVRWLIILLIIVFDPLAVLMLIAANLTQMKQKEWQEEKEKAQPAYEPDDGPLTDEQLNQIKESVDPHPPGWMFEKSSIVENKPEVEKSILESHPYLSKPFDHFKDTTPIVAKKEPEQLKEVNHDNMAQYKIIPDEGIMPMAIEAQAGTPEVDRQDVDSGFTPKPAMETMGIDKPKKSRTTKKKDNIEQVTEDKSNVSIEDQVNTLIANDDKAGLESVYKQIVKELTKNNRSKSTHWGPLKTKK